MSERDHGPRIGADPELFVTSNEDGLVVPICGRLGGTKEEPLIINHIVDRRYGVEQRRRGMDPVEKVGNYAIQEDNVMLEFNVPAYKEPAYFQEAITKMIGVLDTDILPEKGLSLKYEVMHTFKDTDIVKFPQANTVGCLADMDAYVGEGTPRVPFSAAQFGNHRFCGGHLHVQYNKNNVPPYVFAQFMDLVAELPYLRHDRQKMRRMFYGQPGIYRDKPYGIEYRTLSNFWLTRSFRDEYLPNLLNNVYALAQAANERPEALRASYSKIDWGDVAQAIRTENAKMAEEIVEHARNRAGVNMSGCASR